MRFVIHLSILLVTAMAMGCGGSSSGGSEGAMSTQIGSSTQPQRLSHSGRWLTDAEGRVVFLHGVNQINKLPPYHPAALGFGEDDMAFLAEEGFNTIRLGFIWKGFEPQPGQYDMAYLERLFETAQLAADHGLWVLFDFHQDMYNERFNGEGFPDWATLDDGLPAQPDLGFPLNYFVMPALWRAYDHFLANDPGTDGRPMVDALAEAWKRVARRISDVDRLAGYDIWNEPFMGSSLPACASPLGCVDDSDEKLTRVSRKLAEAIRSADPDSLIFYEPFVSFNFGADTGHGGIEDTKAGMSFHNYCLGAQPGLPSLPLITDLCGPTGEQLVFDNAEKQSRETGDALLLSEFGATDDLGTIERMVERADTNLVSWQYWAWWNRDVCCERPEEGIIRDIAEPPTPDNVKQDKLDVLVRAYPRRIAGTPLAFDFDREGRRFELRYSTDRVDGAGVFPPGAVTRIHIPDRHFPDGYRVELSGAQVISAPGAEVLEVASMGGASEITVTVTAPAGTP